MRPNPIPLLVCGYGLALALAAALAAGGLAAIPAVAVFWLGGPVAVLSLASLPRSPFRRRDDAAPSEADPSLADDLAPWEQERRGVDAPADELRRQG